jgi:CIC family chloride channel protein
MFRKLFNKLEELIVWGQSKLTNKQFIFLSSVLVGISAALAVIVLKTFAHWVYAFAIRINKILNLNFIDSILPILGILLTVFVVKKVLGGTIEKVLLKFYMLLLKRQVLFQKNRCTLRL